PVGRPFLRSLPGGKAGPWPKLRGEKRGQARLFLTYFSADAFFGRPRGRSEDSMPSRLTMVRCHVSSPNGLPRLTLRRKRVSSASVIGSFTHSAQDAGRGTGPSCQ